MKVPLFQPEDKIIINMQRKIERLALGKNSKIAIDAMLLTCARILGDEMIPIAKDFITLAKELEEDERQFEEHNSGLIRLIQDIDPNS